MKIDLLMLAVSFGKMALGLFIIGLCGSLASSICVTCCVTALATKILYMVLVIGMGLGMAMIVWAFWDIFKPMEKDKRKGMK